MKDILRPPLRNYTRDAMTPLRAVEATGTGSGLLPRRLQTWTWYLGDVEDDGATPPIATRWLPLVGAMLGGAAEPHPILPSSFYPAGFRGQVLASCALDLDPLGGLAGRDDSSLASRVSRVLRSPAKGSTAELTYAALALNLMGRYRVVIGALQQEAERRRDPELDAEVLRAAYASASGSPETVAALVRIANDGRQEALSRVRAAIRLIAHHSRVTRDTAEASRWAFQAQHLLSEADDDDLRTRLYRSHVDRALALHDWRVRDAGALAAHLESARNAAVALQDLAASPSEDLEALQAERLTLEASLKAFVGHPTNAEAPAARQTASRLLHIDPYDPYACLAAGDALWVLGADTEALDSFERAATAGTIAGALAAHRAAFVLAELDRTDESEYWRRVAGSLDAEAA